jgi:hypothetical protein
MHPDKRPDRVRRKLVEREERRLQCCLDVRGRKGGEVIVGRTTREIIQQFEIQINRQ